MLESCFLAIFNANMLSFQAIYIVHGVWEVPVSNSTFSILTIHKRFELLSMGLLLCTSINFIQLV